jgi:hypothetical protein
MIRTANNIQASAEARPGVIDANAAYTLAEFQKITRMSKWAMRTARREGLKVRRPGGKLAFILGRDALEWLEKAGG